LQQGDLRPVFFEFDKSDIDMDSRSTLTENGRKLLEVSDARVMIEGHCDERGTIDYNLALGDRRALAAKDFLVSYGVDAVRIETISYGESRPFAQGHDEAAWSQNRRAHFRVR
jgi:peptidoglycan-associated lipoprotein